jgi:hypothetical protein
MERLSGGVDSGSEDAATTGGGGDAACEAELGGGESTPGSEAGLACGAGSTLAVAASCGRIRLEPFSLKRGKDERVDGIFRRCGILRIRDDGLLHRLQRPETALGRGEFRALGRRMGDGRDDTENKNQGNLAQGRLLRFTPWSDQPTIFG